MKDYNEAVAYLYASRPPFHQVGATAYKPGLENTLRLMAHVGNPHERLRAVHVAGTNGKGSTSHLIAAALQASGLKVGLFTSPHLVDMRERIRINGVPVPEEAVVDFVRQHRDFLDELQPSFFETMTALAFTYFVRENVDVAVVEVGLGGRLDSTNVLTPVLSVITNIGLDHTEFLGNDLPSIAREKAGIMKPGVPCVIGETDPQTRDIFIERARECGILGEGLETSDCRLWFADRCEYLRQCRLRYAPDCELKGNYQAHNLQTAYVALRALSNIQSPIFNLQSSIFNHKSIAFGFSHVCSLTGLRGRWETLSRQPLTICDTGHNSHGIRYVAQQLSELPNPTIWIVFGMVNDKDTETVMHLLPVGSRYRYVFTTPNTQRARTAQEMAALWNAVHPALAEPPVTVNNPVEAIRYAQQQASKEDVIFIGGSNYLVGEACKWYEIPRVTY